MLRTLLAVFALACMLCFSGCSTENKQQQPSADEQKRIQQEQQKAAEQQKQLTNGMGQTMSEPPPGSDAYGRLHAKQAHKPTNAQSGTPRQQQSTQPNNIQQE